jgi:DeoR/GlpR family transcriptional regulator of sugar metabolism
VLARNLPDISLRIFTTGPNIGMELCRLHEPTITLCSGTINRKNMALSGQNTLDMLEKINIDLALIGRAVGRHGKQDVSQHTADTDYAQIGIFAVMKMVHKPFFGDFRIRHK